MFRGYLRASCPSSRRFSHDATEVKPRDRSLSSHEVSSLRFRRSESGVASLHTHSIP